MLLSLPFGHRLDQVTLFKAPRPFYRAALAQGLNKGISKRLKGLQCKEQVAKKKPNQTVPSLPTLQLLQVHHLQSCTEGQFFHQSRNQCFSALCEGYPFCKVLFAMFFFKACPFSVLFHFTLSQDFFAF